MNSLPNSNVICLYLQATLLVPVAAAAGEQILTTLRLRTVSAAGVLLPAAARWRHRRGGAICADFVLLAAAFPL